MQAVGKGPGGKQDPPAFLPATRLGQRQSAAAASCPGPGNTASNPGAQCSAQAAGDRPSSREQLRHWSRAVPGGLAQGHTAGRAWLLPWAAKLVSSPSVPPGAAQGHAGCEQYLASAAQPQRRVPAVQPPPGAGGAGRSRRSVRRGPRGCGRGRRPCAAGGRRV